MKLAQALRLSSAVSGEVVAFVGGGGKTSSLFTLARESAASGRRVLTTTTTRIFTTQIGHSPAYLSFNAETDSRDALLSSLREMSRQHGQVLLIGATDEASGKALGVAPEVIDWLAQSGLFEAILVEADGSRMRPFKAPAAHEPVIPASTSLVVPVVGLDVIGQPLTDKTTHRAELVSASSGLPLDATITPETVAAVLTHPQSGLKGVPDLARVRPLLNKAEREIDRAAGRVLADLLLASDRIEGVAVGAVQRDDADYPITTVRERIAAVVMAAGGSSRFGSPKQLARWQGQTFIERAVETALASKADSVTVVLGAEVEACRALLAKYPVEIVVNPHWAEGQSTSMQAGLASLPPTVGAAMFLLVDLPQITPDILDQIIHRHRETLAPLIWPEFEGKRGNPVLFDRRLFAELAQVSGDTGGKPVLQAHQAQAERIAVTTRAILQDFDRPEDLAAARQADT